MKITSIFALFFIGMANLLAQPLNYYQTANGLSGAALKAELHSIIEDHVELEYGTIKTVIRQADEDPNNSDNVILLYTGNSIYKFDFANDPFNSNQNDFWNREHVWAKSHGNFGPDGNFTERGANTDAHHLRPVDQTINSARSNKDFDNGGTIVNNGTTPTDCKSTENSWEPRDEVKGDVARMIFYMATRYEGGTSALGDAEPDLEVVEALNTYPNPEMGKLSTLLAWHNQDPVDAFELNRNDVIFNWQTNRNPFIDQPHLVDVIFGTASQSPEEFSNLAIAPVQPTEGEMITVTVNFTGASSPTLELHWGNNWQEALDQTNTLSMTNTSGTTYSAVIPAQLYSAKVHFQIENTASADENLISHNFQIQPEPFTGTITPITTVQGSGAISPLAWQVTDASGTQTDSDNDIDISVTGIVTAVFGDNFFIQESNALRSGMYNYSTGHFPAIGDSVIVTGRVKEYYNMTEMVNVTSVYTVSEGNELPDFQIVSSEDVSTGSSVAEDYESMLVKIYNATCTNTDVGFGMWAVNDGSGECNIHNTAVFEYTPTENTAYNVSGVLNFNFDEFKVDLRFNEDVEAGTDQIAPLISAVSVPSTGIVSVVFTEPITQSSMENSSFYSINNGVVVAQANQHALQTSKVLLWVEELGTGTHTITINGPEDEEGNVVNDSFTFESNFTNISLIEFDGQVVDYWTKRNRLNIKALENITNLAITNIQGQNVFKQTHLDQDLSLELTSGIYFLHLANAQQKQTIKLSIQ
ncbi:MAG: endonuclease [Flavobacteriales bacterium]